MRSIAESEKNLEELASRIMIGSFIKSCFIYPVVRFETTPFKPIYLGLELKLGFRANMKIRLDFFFIVNRKEGFM